MCQEHCCLAFVRNSSTNFKFLRLQRFTWNSESFIIIFFSQSHQVVRIRRFIDEICAAMVHTLLQVDTWQKIVGNFFLFAVCVCKRRERNLRKCVRLFLYTTLTSCVTNGYALTISSAWLRFYFTHTRKDVSSMGVWAWIPWIHHTFAQSTIHITHHVYLYEGKKRSNKRLMINIFFSLVSLVSCTGYGFSLWVCGLLHCVCISFYVNLARFCINIICMCWAWIWIGRCTTFS